QLACAAGNSERLAATTLPKPPGFLSNLLAISGGQLGCLAIAGLAELCFARLLGPTARGLISLCTMSVAFGSMVGSFGNEATVILWTAKFKDRYSYWFPAIAFWVACGCIVSALAWVILCWKVHPSFLQGLTPDLATIVACTIPLSV